jgi:UPF0716 protein FxsA
MLLGLFLTFCVMTVVEIAVLVKVGSIIGVLPTLALIVIISLTGAWLAKHEGFAVLGRMRDKLDQGRMPGDELIDGVLVLTGGILLVAPGFVTDFLGLLMLLPPTRALFRRGAKRYFRRRFAILRVIPARSPATTPPGYRSPYADDDDVIDV